AAKLSRAEAHVQSPGQLVEEIEAGRRVLDLDGIEVELRGQPSHSVHGTAAGAPLRAPERMDRDRDAALVVDRMHGRRARHAGPDAALEEQADDVAVAARDLFTDDHFDAPALREVRRAQRAFDRVVVCDRDHVEPNGPGVVDQLVGFRPSVTERRVHVEVRPTPLWHGCASYARRAYHRLTRATSGLTKGGGGGRGRLDAGLRAQSPARAVAN